MASLLSQFRRHGAVLRTYQHRNLVFDVRQLAREFRQVPGRHHAQHAVHMTGMAEHCFVQRYALLIEPGAGLGNGLGNHRRLAGQLGGGPG